jgi:nucleotide-binding universal stress UspA family protein
MLSFQRILVATDFGAPAEHALELAIELAKQFDAKLTLLHVYAVPPVPYGSAFALMIDELAAMAQKSLDAELVKTKLRFPDCEGMLRPGNAGHEILVAAEEAQAGLIVMGTHGGRGFGALFGSVAEKVVRHAHVPVLTVAARGDDAANSALAATRDA